MQNQDRIRNISVIAQVDVGKSTLIDALICKAGIIISAVTCQRYPTDYRQDKEDKTIKIRSPGTPMYYRYDDDQTGMIEKEKEYFINLINMPGYVDFDVEVTNVLRISDGVLIIADAVQGLLVQGQTVLRQAMQEKVRPILMINKLDRSVLELGLDGEAIYQGLSKVIDMANVVIATYQSQDMGKIQFDPSVGNVAFGSGKDGWAFTINKFAKIYSKKFAIDLDKMMQKLWGNNYFDAQAKQWTTEETNKNGKTLKRSFVQFIIDPICKLFNAIMNENVEQYNKMLKSLEIQLNEQEQNLSGRKLLKVIMNKWLPVSDTLLEMIVLHLPSPKVAQKYRTSHLYEGPHDDVSAVAMKNCDPKGPLMIYISKMIPSSDYGRFYAFGRVFSGTVFSGQNVRIMGAKYKFGKKDDLYIKSINKTFLSMGWRLELILDVPCGNTVILSGIDAYLLKTGTITSINNSQSHPIRSIKYSISPIVSVSVRSKFASDLPKLIEGLRKLSKSDPLVVCSVEQTGNHIVSGCSELHVNICLSDLENDFAQVPIVRSELYVNYKETITARSSQPAMTKSPNKHNRLHGTAEPLHKELIELIENNEVNETQDPKIRGQRLVQQFEWQKVDSQKIWCFGPENKGPNVLVDVTKGIQHLNQIKQSVVTTFQYASKEGVLCGENMRGMRFNLTDCELRVDAIHRGGGQIMPASRRLFYALELLSEPTLQEPIFHCEITTPIDCVGGVYQALNARRGQVVEETEIVGTPIKIIKAFLPVLESFGFDGLLKGQTQGKAYSQCVFDHWENIKGFPLVDPQSQDLVLGIRRRKGEKEEIPILEDYMDKL